MTTSSMSSSPSGFHVKPNEDHDYQQQHHQFFAPNHHIASSSSYSYQFYFNSTGSYPSEVYHPQQRLGGNNCSGSYEVEKTKDDNGLKFSLGTKEGKNGYQAQKNPVKKMKKPDRNGDGLFNNTSMKFEDQKQRLQSSSLETDCSSNSPSNNSSNAPVRVCADCNTTKTPLWRGGPKGPKSLCNACGIRQSKARKALAAAAAAAATAAAAAAATAAAEANGTPFATETPAVKIKVPHKEKTKKNPQTVPFKKRCKAAKINGGTSQEPNKLGGFEDFLINLSKNLSFHGVFPQDEKEAAILLMALSCGLVHG